LFAENQKGLEVLTQINRILEFNNNKTTNKLTKFKGGVMNALFYRMIDFCGFLWRQTIFNNYYGQVFVH
jgi:hypothetical protein